jgi:hypothetical protein
MKYEIKVIRNKYKEKFGTIINRECNCDRNILKLKGDEKFRFSTWKEIEDFNILNDFHLKELKPFIKTIKEPFEKCLSFKLYDYDGLFKVTFLEWKHVNYSDEEDDVKDDVKDVLI